MTRLEDALTRRAYRVWIRSVDARMAGDVEGSRKLLAESRELDARASAMRKRRSDQEDKRMAEGLARLLDAMAEGESA